MLTIGIITGIAAYLLYLVPRFFFRVKEGHVGVIVDRGRAQRDASDKVLLHRPGLHVKLPWHEIVSISCMEQLIDLSGAGGARSAMASDGTILQLESHVRYTPIESDLYAYTFDLGAAREHITNLFVCFLRNEVANFKTDDGKDAIGGSYALIRRERRTLNDRIMKFSKMEIGATYGVRFEAVDLVGIVPPEELDQALSAVLNAQSEADEAYARAEAAAERRVIAAKDAEEIATSKAAASAQEILTIVDQLGELDRAGTLDLYVSRRRAEVLSQSKLHYVRRDR